MEKTVFVIFAIGTAGAEYDVVYGHGKRVFATQKEAEAVCQEWNSQAKAEGWKWSYIIEETDYEAAEWESQKWGYEDQKFFEAAQQ